jgi:signal transduction histidine kinase
MRVSGSISNSLLLRLHGLLVIYRWLALLPPIAGLLLNPVSIQLRLALLGLAIGNAVLHTALHSGLRSGRKPATVYKSNLAQTNQKLLFFSFVLELLVCTVLNSLPGDVYLLYSFAAIFSGVLWLSLAGAILSALVLAASYLAARLTYQFLGYESINWPLTITYLGCFCLLGALASYGLLTANQYHSYANIIKGYRGDMERQNLALEQANRQLEYLSDFSRVLQEGSTPAQVEQLALQYLTRLLSKRQISPMPPASSPDQHARLLKEGAVQEWLQAAQTHPGALKGLHLDRAGIYKVARQGQVFWLATLIYKGEQFGALALPATSDQSLHQPKIEAEEKLLLLLLADQLAHVLGNLKQSQALAVEAERARLAMDMHDVVAQSLFGIAYNLDACVKLADKDPQVSRQRLVDLRTLAFETLASVRAIVYDLWNEEMGETDFAALLQTYIKKAGRLYPFKVELAIKVLPGAPRSDFKLDSESQKSLYRLVQEALANATKHSGASQVQIELCRTPTGLDLILSDNGSGFDPQQSLTNHQPPNQGAARPLQLASGGMGLENMRERLNQLGGNLLVESAPGQGTRIKATLPVAS